MAKAHQLAVILISSLFVAIVSAYPEAVAKPAPKKVEVVVEGMVYCQSCEKYGTWSLTGAEPLASAKVSVTCKNHKGQVSFYQAFEADKKGYFYAELEGYEMTHEYVDHPLQACSLKLVGSPDEKCSLLSNVNDGMNGAALRYENKRFVTEKYETVIYAAGPVAFRPNYCSTTPTHY